MYNVQAYSVLYNNAVCPDICEGWHFTHLWNDRISSLRGEVCANPATFY